MTRKKKSRKPGVGSIGFVKDDKKELFTPNDKKPKKKSGKPSGNRQQEALKKNKSKNQSTQNKDPRIGSKKPIELRAPQKTSADKSAKKATPIKSSPIAAIKVIDNQKTLEDELYAIEQDPSLQAILDKQEQALPLSNEEVDFFNEKMAQHEEIRAQLGWDDEEADESNEPLDEETLWDKLDNSDLSEFES